MSIQVEQFNNPLHKKKKKPAVLVSWPWGRQIQLFTSQGQSSNLFFRLLFSSLVWLFLVFHVEENDAEDEEACHHGEGAGVVWECWGDETLILGVLQGAHRHLQQGEEQITQRMNK